MTNTQAGTKSQELVKQWLYNHGIKTRRAGYLAPFDLYTDNGTRIEVKASPFRILEDVKRWGWCFNIHRHGALDERAVDFYVLRMEPCDLLEKYGFTTAIHLVAKSPLGCPVLQVTPRSLLADSLRWASAVNNVGLIRDADQVFKDIGQKTMGQ